MYTIPVAIVAPVICDRKRERDVDPFECLGTGRPDASFAEGIGSEQ